MSNCNVKNFTLEEGCDFYVTEQLVVKNACGSVSAYPISGDTFSGQIIDNFDCEKVIAVFTCSIIDPVNSIISISIPQATVAAICAPHIRNPDIAEYIIGQYTINWLSAATGRTRIFLRGKVNWIRNANSTG